MSKLRTYILSGLLLVLGLQMPANANKWGSQCEKMWPDCRWGKNIVCENTKNCGPRKEKCYQMDITTEFRKHNLKLQNEWREFVASGEEKAAGVVPASNMHIFNYDFGLEYTALCNANQCEMEHDKCRGTERFPRSGQNLGTKGANPDAYDLYHVEFLTRMWYNEVHIEGFTMPIDKWVHFPGAGHLTALVWAETTHIGCGWSYYNGSTYWAPTVYLACNYGPGGNVKDWATYKRGEPCTACAANETCSKKYTHLCGEEDGKNLVGRNPYDHGTPGIEAGFGICGTLFVVIIVMYFYQ